MSEELAAAYAYLEARHAAAGCFAPRRVLLLCLTNSEGEMLGGDVKRAGISNDLNTVLSAFWRALVEGRQLVIVDPGVADSSSTDPTSSSSWHWLDRRTPISDVLVPSACQRELHERFPASLRRQLSCFNTSRTRRVALSGEIGFSNAAASASVSGAGPGLGLGDEHVPAPFRSHGTLWWVQALTTYLVRIRGRAAARLSGRAWSRMAGSRAAAAAGGIGDAAAARRSTRHADAIEPRCSLLDHNAALQVRSPRDLPPSPSFSDLL